MGLDEVSRLLLAVLVVLVVVVGRHGTIISEGFISGSIASFSMHTFLRPMILQVHAEDGPFLASWIHSPTDLSKPGAGGHIHYHSLPSPRIEPA
jgi:hypothetical protein